MEAIIHFTGIFAMVLLKRKRIHAEMFSSLEKVKVYDASFLDFDNDGFLDLMIAGESQEKEGRGIACIIMTEKEVSQMFPICCLLNRNQENK